MKTGWIFIVLFILSSSLGFSQENQNFGTPEDLMKYFADNIKNGNFDNVFLTSPFSNDSLVDKINPKEAINWLGMISLSEGTHLPAQYHSILKQDLLGKYTVQLKLFIFILLLHEKYPELKTIMPLSELDNYFSALELKNLDPLEFIRMDIYLPDIQFSERGMRNAERQYKKIYGCDEKIEYTVLYKLNEKYYAGGVTVLRYGPNWYIESLKSSYASILIPLGPVSGVAEYLETFEIE